MSAGAVPVTRGCGRRKSGAAYWECGMSPDGRPIEEFLIDAPTLIPPGLAVAPRGVSLITVGGVTHVVDWIGAAHYPNVLDFVAEVARFGLSRRLPSSLDFARLTPASRILLVHARARVENASVYGPFACPKNLHAPGSNACIGVWWEDVEGGAPTPGSSAPRVVRRALPSVSYTARERPAGITARYAPGFFASFPASRLAVVKGGHEKTLVAVLKSSLPVADVDE